jgi:hypothetical protein
MGEVATFEKIFSTPYCTLQLQFFLKKKLISIVESQIINSISDLSFGYKFNFKFLNGKCKLTFNNYVSKPF